jgi:hypothetical protein
VRLSALVIERAGQEPESEADTVKKSKAGKGKSIKKATSSGSEASEEEEGVDRSEEDAFDESAFEKAFFGGSSGDDLDDSGDDDAVDADADACAVANVSQTDRKGAHKKGRERNGVDPGGGTKQKMKADVAHSGSGRDASARKKRKQGDSTLASYSQYAHLLDQYDEVNKQALPQEELEGRGKSRKKQSKRRTA